MVNQSSSANRATERPTSRKAGSLYLAFELDSERWELGFTSAWGRRRVGGTTGDLAALEQETALGGANRAACWEARY